MQQLLPYITDSRLQQQVASSRQVSCDEIVNTLLNYNIPNSIAAMVLDSYCKQISLPQLKLIIKQYPQISTSEELRQNGHNVNKLLLSSQNLQLLSQSELSEIVANLRFYDSGFVFQDMKLSDLLLVDLLFLFLLNANKQEILCQLLIKLLPIALKGTYFAKLQYLLNQLIDKLSQFDQQYLNLASVIGLQLFYFPLCQLAVQESKNPHLNLVYSADLSGQIFFVLNGLNSLFSNEKVLQNVYLLCSLPEFLFSIQQMLKTLYVVYQLNDQYQIMIFGIIKRVISLKNLNVNALFSSEISRNFAEFIHNINRKILLSAELKDCKLKKIHEFIENNDNFKNLDVYFSNSDFLFQPSFLCEVLTLPKIKSEFLNNYFISRLDSMSRFSVCREEPMFIIYIRRLMSNFLLAGEGQQVGLCVSAISKIVANKLKVDETSTLIVVGAVMMINTQSSMLKAGKKYNNAMNSDDFIHMVSTAPKFNKEQFTPEVLNGIFEAIMQQPLSVRSHIFTMDSQQMVNLSSEVLNFSQQFEQSEQFPFLTRINQQKQIAKNYQPTDSPFDYTLGTLEYVDFNIHGVSQEQLKQFSTFSQLQIFNYQFPVIVNLLVQSQQMTIVQDCYDQLLEFISQFQELKQLPDQLQFLMQRCLMTLISATQFNLHDILSGNELSQILIFITDFYSNPKKQIIVRLSLQILPLLLASADINDEFMQQIFIFMVQCQQILLFGQHSFIPIETIFQRISIDMYHEIRVQYQEILQNSEQYMNEANVKCLLVVVTQFLQQIKNKQLISFDYSDILGLSFRQINLSLEVQPPIMKTQNTLIISPLVQANMYCAMFTVLYQLTKSIQQQHLIQYLNNLLEIAQQQFAIDMGQVVTRQNFQFKQFPPQQPQEFKTRFVLQIAESVYQHLTQKEQQDLCSIIAGLQISKENAPLFYKLIETIRAVPPQFFAASLYSEELFVSIVRQNIAEEFQCDYFDFRKMVVNPSLSVLQQLFKLFSNQDFDLNWIKQQVRTTHQTVLPYFSCVFKQCLETKLYHEKAQEDVKTLFAKLLKLQNSGQRIKIGEHQIPLSFITKLSILLIGNYATIQDLNDNHLQFPDGSEEAAFVSASVLPLFIELIHINNPKK